MPLIYDVNYSTSFFNIFELDIHYQNNLSFKHDVLYSQELFAYSFDANYAQIIPFMYTYDVGYNTITTETYVKTLLPQRSF